MNGYEGPAVAAASVLARLAARLFGQRPPVKATLDKTRHGCEFWRNHNATIWFVKCMSCPAVGIFSTSLADADDFAVHHQDDVHGIFPGR